MSLAETKAALREEMFARRKQAHGTGLDAGANARLAARLGVVSKETVVSAYLPIRTEIDPTPTMTALHLAGVRVCTPVIERKGRPLKFRAWTPDCEMIEGPFGTKAPARGDWLEPTILIVPLLAWDRAGWRLGYGGGFYDRTLERLRGRRPTTAIGFAYAAQQQPDVPREATDQRLDVIVTEAETVEAGA